MRVTGMASSRWRGIQIWHLNQRHNGDYHVSNRNDPVAALVAWLTARLTPDNQKTGAGWAGVLGKSGPGTGVGYLHNVLLAVVLLLSVKVIAMQAQKLSQYRSPHQRASADDAMLGLAVGMGAKGAARGEGAGGPAIPGSRLQPGPDVSAFRRLLRCVESEGQWREDPTPRLLPWPYDEGNFGHCDGRWTWTQGHVSHQAADDVARRKGSPTEWTVRPSIKFAWTPDERRCGAGAKIRPFNSLELSRVLTGKGKGKETGERVVLFVGDSMQHAMAVALYDNMRVGLTKEEQQAEAVPLVPASLPCYVRGVSHRRMCWGAHFFSRSQPGMKLVFVRNDFLSPLSKATWARDGRDFQLPWLQTVRDLVKGEYQWLEGGTMKAPRRKSGEPQPAESYRQSPKQKRVLPPVLVLNRGVHYVEDSRFFLELNASMIAAREACPDCVIVFRNTPGGHKKCNSISMPLLERSKDRILPYNWTQVGEQSRDPRTREIVESVGGVFLDVEAMTSLRADGHTGKNRQGREDCTHYCAPGPLDTWIQLLSHTLQQLLG